MSRRIATLVALGLLQGCSILPSGGPVPDLYTLSGLGAPAQAPATLDWPLAIEEPIPAGGLGTDRIAVRPSPLELRYFSKVRWAERMPRMVQTLLVQSFQDSGALTAITRQPIGLHRGYSLRTEIRAFEVRSLAPGQAPVIQVTISAQLVALPQEEIVAAKVFAARPTARGKEMKAVVEAFDEGLDQVLAQIVEWVLGAGAAAAPLR